MQLRVKFYVGSAVVSSFLAGMALPTLLGATNLLHTSAQTNPCLPQDATISAQHSVVLQASLDAINYQATLTAVHSAPGSSAAGAVTATSVPATNTPFTDNFTNNKRGWNLAPQDNGSASLSQGALVLNLTKAPVFAVPIPGIVPNEFYLESDITVRKSSGETAIGYYIGDSTGQLTALTVKQDYDKGVFVVYKYDGTHLTVVSSIPVDKPLWVLGKSIRLGLNASGGLYSLYFGGTVVASTQITGASKEVGFINVEDYNNDPIVTSFGKLVVQSALKQ